MDELTTAQIMFITLSGMEDARIKAGGGPVERNQPSSMDGGMSVADYAKFKKSMRPGGEDYELMKQRKANQLDIRKQITKLAIEELKNEDRPVR